MSKRRIRIAGEVDELLALKSYLGSCADPDMYCHSLNEECGVILIITSNDESYDLFRLILAPYRLIILTDTLIS